MVIKAALPAAPPIIIKTLLIHMPCSCINKPWCWLTTRELCIKKQLYSLGWIQLLCSTTFSGINYTIYFILDLCYLVLLRCPFWYLKSLKMLYSCFNSLKYMNWHIFLNKQLNVAALFCCLKNKKNNDFWPLWLCPPFPVNWTELRSGGRYY